MKGKGEKKQRVLRGLTRRRGRVQGEWGSELGTAAGAEAAREEEEAPTRPTRGGKRATEVREGRHMTVEKVNAEERRGT